MSRKEGEFIPEKLNLKEQVIKLAKEEQLEQAVQLVLESEINSESETTWNELISECVNKGRVKLGIRLLNEMKRFALQPNINTYMLLLNGLAEYRALPDNVFHARAIVDSIRRAGRRKSEFQLKTEHANALLKALVNNYDTLFHPGSYGALTANRETHTIVLRACARNCVKYPNTALPLALNIWNKVFQKAIEHLKKPGIRTEEDAIDDELVCAMLLVFRNSDQIDRGFLMLKEIYGIGDDVIKTRPYNLQMTSKSLDLMMGLCFKSQKIDLGIKLFHNAKVLFPNIQLDIENFNSLISLYNKSEQYDNAIDAFKQALDLGIEPKSTTFDLLMVACRNSQNLESVKEIFGIIIKHKVVPKATALTKILELTLESNPIRMTKEVRWILNKIDQIGLNNPRSLVTIATKQGAPKLPFEIDDKDFLRTIINAYGVALDKAAGKLPDHTEERWTNNMRFYKSRLWDINQKEAQIEQSRMQKERALMDKKNKSK
ncbi:15640_t:CDS:2 [Cetraspora pellucida]|uniref:15640_t:CDS:1 n=1 Tax=Cetraspora pellucida TaxID=1433469 RepID=A0ACA9JZZ8_9GLOM|nr:15640_t:CDS:2 [Cetraspora pellucida]